eukprot:scaffold7099_cov281-Pinguiococcus_pyrenoidosus.AAC.22
MGCVMESSIPKTLRWIPAGMQVKYVSKAVGTLKATSELPEDFFHADTYPAKLDVPIVLKDPNEQVVVTAAITVYVSEKPKKKQMRSGQNQNQNQNQNPISWAENELERRTHYGT